MDDSADVLGFASVDALSLSDDDSADVDGDVCGDDPSDAVDPDDGFVLESGSANAIAGELAMATPMPSATANPPTRPM